MNISQYPLNFQDTVEKTWMKVLYDFFKILMYYS